MIILSVLALNFSFFGTGLAETADIKIDQSEKRMKAIIPAENSVAPGREPNLIERGAGAVGHGLYAVAKTGVQGVGNGLDAVVDVSAAPDDPFTVGLPVCSKTIMKSKSVFLLGLAIGYSAVFAVRHLCATYLWVLFYGN